MSLGGSVTAAAFKTVTSGFAVCIAHSGFALYMYIRSSAANRLFRLILPAISWLTKVVLITFSASSEYCHFM